jgi:hypothetical protein
LHDLALLSYVLVYLADKCLLTDNIYDYYNVSQGKITIPNMDDGEENQLTDVSKIDEILVLTLL